MEFCIHHRGEKIVANLSIAKEVKSFIVIVLIVVNATSACEMFERRD